MYEVQMPKLSDSMEEGKIIAWKVKEGDEVHEGDVLAEVESDKAVMELECFRDGVVAEIVHGDETEVPVGDVIARIREKGDVAAVAQPPPAAESPEPAAHEKPSAPAKPPAPEPPSPDVARPPSAAKAGPEHPAPTKRKRVAISPYARKLAQQKGIDYTRLQGSGPGGRIIARDIEAASADETPVGTATEAPPIAAEKKSVPAPPPGPAPKDDLPALDVTDDEAEVVAASFRHKTQARRVTAAKHLIPHFYLTRRVDVTALAERQRELKVQTGATITHLVMLACLKALKEHPEVNRSYDHGRIIKWRDVNLGLAVDTDEGLTVAVLSRAQDLSLEDLVERTGPLVERARAGKLTADERRHASFTVTNLGMFSVDEFAPIINPPSAITLAVASALPSVIVKGNAIRIGTVMALTAASDHRIVDGVTAARFMKDLAAILEDVDRLVG